MKTLITYLIFTSLLIGQNHFIKDETLFINGNKNIQLAYLSDRDTGKRIYIGEVELTRYVLPLVNIPRGVYTLSIFSDKVRYARTIENDVEGAYKPIDYVSGYYYEKTTYNYKRSGYTDKANIVAFIEQQVIDQNSINGRKNTLKVWQIKNGIKKLVYP